MASKDIHDHISSSYNRWLDYARYQAKQASIEDQAEDVLNTVMVSLLEKDETFMLSLFNEKKDQYIGLDFYILRMIKLNAYSKTSPYRF